MELCPTKPIWVISQHALKAKNDGLVSQGALPLGKQTPLTKLHQKRVILQSVCAQCTQFGQEPPKDNSHASSVTKLGRNLSFL